MFKENKRLIGLPSTTLRFPVGTVQAEAIMSFLESQVGEIYVRLNVSKEGAALSLTSYCMTYAGETDKREELAELKRRMDAREAWNYAVCNMDVEMQEYDASDFMRIADEYEEDEEDEDLDFDEGWDEDDC